MKVRTLAGHRTPRPVQLDSHAGQAGPQYRFTFKTWIKRTWMTSRDGMRSDTVQERTMTVLASSEREAIDKIQAALPPAPAIRDGYYYGSERHERKWESIGPIIELES